MALTAADVKSGAFFVTVTEQLRKVTSVERRVDGTKVRYLSKSAKIKNRPFSFGPTMATPPSMESFLADCGRLLAQSEIDQLRRDKIILEDE